jgi:hypothetical protein
VAPAPALAASPPLPLVITATRSGGGSSTKVLFTFRGGTGVLDIVLVQRGATTVSVVPDVGISANGGTAEGTGNSYVLGATYTVTYMYQGVQQTQPVLGT